MNAAQRHQAAKRIFLDACDLPPHARAAFLDAQCAGDAELRAAIQSMLDADASSAPALDNDSARMPLERILDDEAARASQAAAAPSPLPARHPDRIGRYRIIRQIGEGGMGAVYEAEQENPRRRVALKVARPNLATTDAVQRLVIEAQVLGHLQHPGIAQVFEAGVAPLPDATGGITDTPFFAMELIDGEPLDAFAREHLTDTRARLELFALICDAVHHAHQKGVIHRDLKPANILVVSKEPGASTHAGTWGATAVGGSPKILDFGVARLIAAEGAEAGVAALTMHTAAGQVIGTLAYMSPEQVAGRIAEIDARTDIYSLGVILYELLAGRPPLDLRNMPLAEAARAIEHREPPLLGTIDPALRGDVETIAGKAMAKSPADRYASAAALADDIRRCLRDEPITARPPSTLYQFRKFARRNRGAVVAGSITLAAIVIGFGATAVEAIALARANRLEREARSQAQEREAEAQAARKVALDRQAEAEAAREQAQLREAEAKAARAEAQQNEAEARSEAAKFRAVTDFLQEMLASADPGQGPNDPGITLVEMLDTTADRLDAGSLAEQPDVDTAIRMTLGNTYRALARYDEALAHLQRAVEIGSRIYPDGHEDLSWALNKLSRTYIDMGDYDNAERTARETLDMRLRIYGEEHLDTATAMNNLAYVCFRRANYDEATDLYERSLAIRRRLVGNDHEMIANSLNNIAVLKFTIHDHAAAVPLFRESLEIDRNARGADHPNIALTMTNLAAALRELGQLDEALPLLDDSLAMITRLHGTNHPLTARITSIRATTLQRAGRLEEAERDLRAALDILRAVHGDSHPAVANALGSLAAVLSERADHQQAADLRAEALAIHRATEGEDHPNTINAGARLGEALLQLGRRDEAATVLQAALDAAHRAGDLSGVDLPEIRRLRGQCTPDPAQAHEGG